MQRADKEKNNNTSAATYFFVPLLLRSSLSHTHTHTYITLAALLETLREEKTHFASTISAKRGQKGKRGMA